MPKFGIPKFISIGGSEKKSPIHMAVSAGPVKSYVDDSKKDVKEALEVYFEKVDEVIDYQIKNEVRVVTVHINDKTPEMLQALKSYFSALLEDERITKNQARVFVIGQWYELDFELSEAIKSAMEKTKAFDNLFINFCINYDGREEILGAIRLTVRKIMAGKLSENDLTEDVVKENIYTSYFPPPQLIIETQGQYAGTLLWDAPGAVIYYSDKQLPEFDKKDIEAAVTFFDKIKKASE
jgi:undecaprenyl diphosphate synthase